MTNLTMTRGPTAAAPGGSMDESSEPTEGMGRDGEQCDQLLERYRPLAMGVLRRLGCGWDEDLAQVALLGLVKAIQRFDSGRGISFATFAWPTIAGEVKRYLRDHARLVRPPRSLSDLRIAVLAKEAELAQELGRSPTIAEIASALDTDLDRVMDAMALDDICRPYSLDRLSEDSDPDRPAVLVEAVGAKDPELERAEMRAIIDEALAALEPRLQKVLTLRYYDCLSQREAGERLGVSQMHVSRLEHRALQELREHLPADAQELLAA